VINHVFFNTTQKVSVNPCTGSAPVHQGERKHGRANPYLKQWWSFFSTSEGLFTWLGCLKVRPLTRSTTRRFWQTFMKGWEENTWNVEERRMDSSPRQRAGTQRPVCQDFFDEAQDHRVGTSTVLTWPSPMWLLFPPKIKSALKGTGFESVDAVKAKATELMNKLSEDLQLCFQQWKIRMVRCTLRVTTFILCNFLSKKYSNTSPVIL